jgi:hypothetical protein
MILGVSLETIRWMWWESALWAFVILWMYTFMPPSNRR